MPKRKNAHALGVMDQNRATNLNDDSDDEEIETDKNGLFEFDNDGNQVGGSGSEKGEEAL